MSNTRNVLTIKPLRYYENDISKSGGKGVFSDYTPGLPATSITESAYPKISKYKTKKLPSGSETIAYYEEQNKARQFQLNFEENGKNGETKHGNNLDFFPIKRAIGDVVDIVGINTRKSTVRKNFKKC